MNGAINLYSRAWTDIVMFEMADRVFLLALLLNGMVLNSPPVAIPPTDTAVKLADLAWSIYNKAEEIANTKNHYLE